MNPYEPSQVSAQPREPKPPLDLSYNSLLKVCETIFLEWERRRWIWNVVLLGLLLLGQLMIEQRSHDMRIDWGLFLYVTLILNLIHFVGPTIEFLATWALKRRVVWGKTLFVLGLSFYVFLIVGGYFGLWVIQHLRCSGH